jgi:hypothetical protein
LICIPIGRGVKEPSQVGNIIQVKHIQSGFIMKTKLHCLLIALAILLGLNHVLAQGTAFTYQGRLNDHGAPANGSYDLVFTLFNTNFNGTAIAGPVTNSATSVSNGLFTTLIDFGNAFTGSSNWLEIAVSTNGASSFTTLSPRQQVTPAPYAITAENVSGIGNNNRNFFIGSAGNATTTGAYNTANGNEALAANTTGSFNTANGFGALNFNTTGEYNTANGFGALDANTTGEYNTANGVGALENNTTGDDNTANGVAALEYNTTGSNNTANGFVALYANTTGSENTANGNDALENNTTGDENTANGVAALEDNTTGDDNTANGVAALEYNTTGSDNTANGVYALYANTNGSENTANGYAALYANMWGYDNTANGFEALYANTWGFDNTADGNDALYHNTTGNNNIALGNTAGYFITTGNYNIDIGNSGVSGDNSIIRIGTPGTQTATYLAGIVYANGVALTSDRDAKENFTPVNAQKVLAKVAALPMSQWNYKSDRQDVQHLGPMAQDFQAAFGLDGADDKHISVIDEGGVALAAIQGLNQKLEQQDKDKDAEIQDLKQRLEALEKIVLNRKSN